MGKCDCGARVEKLRKMLEWRNHKHDTRWEINSQK